MYCKGRGVHRQSTKNQVCILLDLLADHWQTSVITQIVSLNSYDLFFAILVTRTIQMDYCTIARKKFDYF